MYNLPYLAYSRDGKKNAFRFNYKEYNTEARYALVEVDGEWAWWTPYHPGLNVEHTTSIILADTGNDSIIWDCINHFEKLWNIKGEPKSIEKDFPEIKIKKKKEDTTPAIEGEKE